MTNLSRTNFQFHPYHLASPSLWPRYTSFSAGFAFLSAGLCMHSFNLLSSFSYSSFSLIVLFMLFWFRDIISEATFLGDHTLAVKKGLALGILLFIISEALFFMTIFWAYFHSALTPSVELGAQWPPLGLEPVDPLELPLLNTVILLCSGSFVTYAHHSTIQTIRLGSFYSSIATLILAIIFSGFQGIEYIVSSFTISDGVFGSCFFVWNRISWVPCNNRNYFFNSCIVKNSSLPFYSGPSCGFWRGYILLAFYRPCLAFALLSGLLLGLLVVSAG